MNRLRRRKLSTFTIQTQGNELPHDASNRKTSSVVYHRHALDLGICPRMVRHTTDLRMLDWKRYGWDKAGLEPRQRIRGWAGFFKNNKRESETRPCRKTKRTSCSLYTLEEERIPLTSRSLPPLPTNGLGEPMLRRPTVIPPHPVTEGGEIFKMITKGRELKPFSFEDDPAKANKFYDTHFPLLCKKLRQGSLPGSARAVTQLDVDPARVSSAERRTRDLLDRMSDAERLLAEIECDSDSSEAMVTELRDVTFDPTSWSWNKERYAVPDGYTVNTRPSKPNAGIKVNRN
ncbi:uncharacterized protein LOC101857077 [Aplysia californica]|uniref:Uncharacterized protein LOC101857077 n=1 Tax=Aplysia californica TaxID=6500 RepID=A0ABM0K8X9_APLCA|nr:uncharacterized protein LOC101857077 [Aplysia californica]